MADNLGDNLQDNLQELRVLTAALTKNDADILRFQAIDAISVWENFYDILPIPICVAGLDNYFKKINLKFCELLGYTKDQLLSNPWTYYVHPDDLEMTYSQTGKQDDRNIKKQFTNRYKKVSGEYVKLDWLCTTISQGLFICTVTVVK